MTRLDPKTGDRVELEDGGVGVVVSVSPSYFNVKFDSPAYFDGGGGRTRSYNNDGTHCHNEIPRIKRITHPMTTTPYDTQIAAAEKALAKLKAKAIAEAEKAKKPDLGLKPGQVWVTKSGAVVTLEEAPCTPTSVVVKAAGIWYCADGTPYNDMYSAESLVREATRRWYKDLEEWMTFLATFAGPIIAIRRITSVGGSPDSVQSGRPVIDNGEFKLLPMSSSTVNASNYDKFEYSTDGKTWQKFGVYA